MILEYLTIWITTIIAATGYFGIFLFMVAESMVLPVPSEAIMPFAGFLIAENKFSFFIVFIASSLGSVVGSLISYYIGSVGSKTIIPKYGKYFLLNNKDLEWTENWFKKNGQKTIFISRFIPVIRHIISIPAGMAKMDLKKFIIYTFIGASIWNMALAYAGYALKQKWYLLHEYSRELDIIIIILLVLVIIFHVYRHIKHKNYKEYKSS
ncbi:DedA family protein [Candidatus Woesearchaeota archaeon]|nr:DedA family protein [Candidatus Woesearchaeota archaeon]